MPPQPKLPLTLFSAMSRRTLSATASDVPPAPVWKEKPSLSRPEAWMTSAAYLAMSRPAGSRVTRVVVETIFLGSPSDSICTTKSTSDWEMLMGAAG